MADSLVELEVRDRIGFVTLNDPARRNALGPDLLDAFHCAWTEVERNSEVRVVVLGASGVDFCAGGDISTFDRGAAMLWGTEGIAEGRRAFYEKRAPAFPDE